MGNFLSYIASFDWTNPNVDRRNEIENLNRAIQLANEEKEKLFWHYNFFSPGSASCTLFLLLWSTDFNTFKATYNWIDETHFQVLMRLPNFFKLSEISLTSLNDLHTFTGEINKAWIGLNVPCAEYLVHDESSWRQFHNNIVSKFNRIQRQQNIDYFLEYFIPTLNINQNQIANLILKNQVDPLFQRIESPTLNEHGEVLHGEKIHIHFSDAKGSALNIDGTWKHGGFDLPNEVCDKLIEWGFILPENIT